MNWEELVRETAHKAGCSPEYAKEILDAFFDTVVCGMQRDRLVMLRPDLGYFEMRETAGAVHRTKTPVFRKSGQLKSLLRGEKKT